MEDAAQYIDILANPETHAMTETPKMQQLTMRCH